MSDPVAIVFLIFAILFAIIGGLCLIVGITKLKFDTPAGIRIVGLAALAIFMAGILVFGVNLVSQIPLRAENALFSFGIAVIVVGIILVLRYFSYKSKIRK
jgi:hypothetical protein